MPDPVQTLYSAPAKSLTFIAASLAASPVSFRSLSLASFNRAAAFPFVQIKATYNMGTSF
jgi:hypothetical protein